MQKLAAKTRKKEIIISLFPKLPIFLSRIENSIKKVTIPDNDVAKAIPAIFNGYIKTMMKITFNNRERAAILVGVTVSFKLKKQDCNILVAP